MKYTLSIMIFFSFFTLAKSGNDDKAFVQTQHMVFQLNDFQAFNVSLHRGDIDIRAIDGDKINIEILKKARASSKEVAENLFNNIDFIHERQREDFVFRSEFKGENYQELIDKMEKGTLETKLSIELPKKVFVKGSTLYGDITARGFKKGISLSTMNGNVNVADIEKNTEVYIVNGNLHMSSMKGPSSLKLYSGNIELEDVEGDIIASNNSGNIKITRVTGKLMAKSVSGNIYLSKVKGDVTSTSIKGKINLRASLGSAELATKKGSIEVRGFIMDEEGQLKVSSEEGDLRAHLPSSVSGDLEMRTGHGIIYNDFEVRSASGKIIRWRPKRTTLTGKLNFDKQGKNRVFLKTDNGDIFLKKQ